MTKEEFRVVRSVRLRGREVDSNCGCGCGCGSGVVVVVVVVVVVGVSLGGLEVGV